MKPFYIQPYPISYALLGSQENTTTVELEKEWGTSATTTLEGVLRWYFTSIFFVLGLLLLLWRLHTLSGLRVARDAQASEISLQKSCFRVRY